MAAQQSQREMERSAFDEMMKEEEETGGGEEKRQKKDAFNSFCDFCFSTSSILLKNIAFYLCYTCNMYFCENCFRGHDESHIYIKVFSEEREKEICRKRMLKEMREERKKGSMKVESLVSVCDFVLVKHKLDKKEHCAITGLCGFDFTRLVICDYNNSCIKIFSLGTNILQRYIRFESPPYDVTEVLVYMESTELDSASARKSNHSVTDKKPRKTSLLAVTLPWKRLILIIDLNKNPAVIIKNKTINTEKECLSIEFYEDKIFTVCGDLTTSHTVHVVSVEGVLLYTIPTRILGYIYSYLAVLDGNVYMTEYDNNKVICFNDEAELIKQSTISESGSRGICVDRKHKVVYVCAMNNNKVYQMDADLDRYKLVLDQTIDYMENPQTLCFYRNKLYVSHREWSSQKNYVTVIRLV